MRRGLAVVYSKARLKSHIEIRLTSEMRSYISGVGNSTKKRDVRRFSLNLFGYERNLEKIFLVEEA